MAETREQIVARVRNWLGHTRQFVNKGSGIVLSLAEFDDISALLAAPTAGEPVAWRWRRMFKSGWGPWSIALTQGDLNAILELWDGAELEYGPLYTHPPAAPVGDARDGVSEEEVDYALGALGTLGHYATEWCKYGSADLDTEDAEKLETAIRHTLNTARSASRPTTEGES